MTPCHLDRRERVGFLVQAEKIATARPAQGIRRWLLPHDSANAVTVMFRDFRSTSEADISLRRHICRDGPEAVVGPLIRSLTNPALQPRNSTGTLIGSDAFALAKAFRGTEIGCDAASSRWC